MRSIQRAISRHTSPSHTLTPQLLRTSRPDRAGGRRSPLGFHIGPTNRALTFQLPNHPWQIKDCYSDGSQRCWTAVAGALHPRGYPTSSITERACRHYLERLCIAAQRPKEHASATSLRIVSNTPLPRSLEAPTQQFACVCVCRTLCLENFTTKFQAGEWSRPAELHLTKGSAVSRGYHSGRPVTYLRCDTTLL